MGSLKKRRKDSFLTLISNTYLFIIHPANNIFYANKGCNDILFDNIILSSEFKFGSGLKSYIVIIYIYVSINKRFTTTIFVIHCCGAKPHTFSVRPASRPLQVSWVINDSWRKPCPNTFSQIIGNEQFMRSIVGCLETIQPDIKGVM